MSALAHIQSPTLADIRQASLSSALAGIGWCCTEATIDLDANRARVSFKSDTGRLVTLDADGIGRVTITREQADTRLVRVGRRNCATTVERHGDTFIGRTRCLGIRSGLRVLADYLADNAGTPRALVRAPFAALLAEVAS